MDINIRPIFQEELKTMKIEKISYAGWKNCFRIDNSAIELSSRPMLVHASFPVDFKGKENLFYNNPAEMGTSGAKEYVGYGGHRLWAAPELAKRTYYPDNFPVEVKTLTDGVWLTSAVETTTGIQKTMEIHMDDKEPRVPSAIPSRIAACGRSNWLPGHYL